MTVNVFALYIKSKVLLSLVLKYLKDKNIVFDDDNSMTDSISAIQVKINSLHARVTRNK